jgi:hypothetical protein
MATRKSTIKCTCVQCSKVFDALRSDAETCSAACRAKLHRARRAKMMADQTKTIKSQSKLIQVAVSEVMKPLLTEKRVRTYSKFTNCVLLELPSVAHADIPSDIKQLSYKQVCDELTKIMKETKEAAFADKLERGNVMRYMKDPDRFRQLCHWEIELSKQFE